MGFLDYQVMKKMRSSASHFTERTKRNEKEKAAGKWLVKIKNKFNREQLDFLRKLWLNAQFLQNMKLSVQLRKIGTRGFSTYKNTEKLIRARRFLSNTARPRAAWNSGSRDESFDWIRSVILNLLCDIKRLKAICYALTKSRLMPGLMEGNKNWLLLMIMTFRVWKNSGACFQILNSFIELIE